MRILVTLSNVAVDSENFGFDFSLVGSGFNTGSSANSVSISSEQTAADIMGAVKTFIAAWMLTNLSFEVTSPNILLLSGGVQ